jgi:hypothetical protein
MATTVFTESERGERGKYVARQRPVKGELRCLLVFEELQCMQMCRKCLNNSELWEWLVVAALAYIRKHGFYPDTALVKRWATEWPELCPLLQLPTQTRLATAWVVCQMLREYRAKYGDTPAPSYADFAQHQGYSLHFSPCQFEPDSIELPMIGEVRFSKRYPVFEKGRSTGDSAHVWRSPAGLWYATPKFRRTSLGR